MTSQTLALYKQLLRASNKFNDYNFKHYFIRRVTHEFRNPNSEVSVAEGYNQLSVIQAQATINNMYVAEPTVVESPWEERK